MSEFEQNPQPTESPTISTQAPTAAPTVKTTSDAEARQYTLIIYVLYMASILVGVTSIVGVIMAYIKRADFAGTEYEPHLTYLIRTFWISLIGYLIGMATIIVGIGAIIIIAAGVWFIYRSIAGFIKFNDRKPIDPMGWL